MVIIFSLSQKIRWYEMRGYLHHDSNNSNSNSGHDSLVVFNCRHYFGEAPLKGVPGQLFGDEIIQSMHRSLDSKFKRLLQAEL